MIVFTRESASIQFPRRGKASRWMDLTPIVDVVFLLLVFFVVTARLPTPAMDVALPEARSGSTAPDEAVRLTIDASGRYFVTGVATGTGALQESLRRELRRLSTARVRIRADQRASVSAFVGALDGARLAGATQVAVENEPQR
jgi:biopolymer transport protein ExbD